MISDGTLDKAYQDCLKIAQNHYENFPTASRLLAKPQQRATAAIYAFARTADDIADEGDVEAAVRHARLDSLESTLSQIGNDITPDEPIFMALADTIRQYRLPIKPFENLLQAFRSDIDVKRYETYSQLAQYCEHSANPVGELVLRLHNKWNPVTARLSDNICTALQLVNFIQDLESDYNQRGRLYLPLDELQQFNTNESDIANHKQSQQLTNLVHYQLNRANSLLQAGSPLISHCNGRLRLLLKLTVRSGQRIHDKLITRQNIYVRPTLGAGDFALIIIRSLLF